MLEIYLYITVTYQSRRRRNIGEKGDERGVYLQATNSSSSRVACGGGGEVSSEEILKTNYAGEAISSHFAMRLKSHMYLNYAYLQMFQRRKSPFIPCF